MHIPLQCGPLQLIFLPDDGSVRYLFAGGREVLRGIAAPIRDQAWATIRPQLSALQITQLRNSFRVTFRAHCRGGPVDFRWDGEIAGSASGEMTFAFDGEALSDFSHNRIGFCVLHGAELAGTSVVVEHVDGRRTNGRLPTRIETGAPFTDIRAITHSVFPDVRAEVRMDGDAFEMEDQRNWTDASFKTFCTPSRLPKPFAIHRGTRIQQRITLTLHGAVPTGAHALPPPWEIPVEAQVDIGAPLGGRLPALGTTWNTVAASPDVVAALQPLGLAHLRVDLWLNDPAYRARLAAAATAANSLGARLELAVHVDDSATAQLGRLTDELARLPQPPRMARWLVYHEAHDATPPASIAAAREVLAGSPFAAPVGGGALDHFTELNYHPAVAAVADFTVHGNNPQVHAFDEWSIAETLPMQALNAENARERSGGKPVVVSPVTFTRRWRGTDTGAPTGLPAGLLPFQEDARLDGGFVAAWTVGSVSALATAGVASVTYYETQGANGLLDAEGRRRPVAEALAVFGDWSHAQVCAATSSDPWSLAALPLNDGTRRGIILANLRSAPQRVRISGAWGERAVVVASHAVTCVEMA